MPNLDHQIPLVSTLNKSKDRQEAGRQEVGRQEAGRREVGRQEVGRQEVGRQKRRIRSAEYIMWAIAERSRAYCMNE